MKKPLLNKFISLSNKAHAHYIRIKKTELLNHLDPEKVYSQTNSSKRFFDAVLKNGFWNYDFILGKTDELLEDFPDDFSGQVGGLVEPSLRSEFSLLLDEMPDSKIKMLNDSSDEEAFYWRGTRLFEIFVNFYIKGREFSSKKVGYPYQYIVTRDYGIAYSYALRTRNTNEESTKNAHTRHEKKFRNLGVGKFKPFLLSPLILGIKKIKSSSERDNQNEIWLPGPVTISDLTDKTKEMLLKSLHSFIKESEIEKWLLGRYEFEDHSKLHIRAVNGFLENPFYKRDDLVELRLNAQNDFKGYTPYKKEITSICFTRNKVSSLRNFRLVPRSPIEINGYAVIDCSPSVAANFHQKIQIYSYENEMIEHFDLNNISFEDIEIKLNHDIKEYKKATFKELSVGLAVSTMILFISFFPLGILSIGALLIYFSKKIMYWRKLKKHFQFLKKAYDLKQDGSEI